jgi:hypothetical protein
MSLLDTWPEAKAKYTRLVKSTAVRAAGMQTTTFTAQVEPLVGILLPSSRGLQRMIAGTAEEVTHVFYTQGVIITGDKIQDADDKYYVAGRVLTHGGEYTEVWLRDL